MSDVTQQDILNFWIRCYINPSTNPIDAVIDRAYRDFNRTLHGISKVQTEAKYLNLKNVMYQIILEISNVKFKNQREFDKWHESKCTSLITAFNVIANHKLYIGQAQKWLNMSLKYLFALGEDFISGIRINYTFFHIPIDNIIQDQLIKHGIPKLECSWSRIDDYCTYLNYQKMVRNKFLDQIPLAVEFKLFNES